MGRVSYPNEASINTNGMYQFGSSTIRKVTSIVREFDEEGRVVKETETITEYSPTPNYGSYPPYYPYTISSGTIQSRTTN